jgi:hypothetical protein
VTDLLNRCALIYLKSTSRYCRHVLFHGHTMHADRLRDELAAGIWGRLDKLVSATFMRCEQQNPFLSHITGLLHLRSRQTLHQSLLPMILLLRPVPDLVGDVTQPFLARAIPSRYFFFQVINVLTPGPDESISPVIMACMCSRLADGDLAR